MATSTPDSQPASMLPISNRTGAPATLRIWRSRDGQSAREGKQAPLELDRLLDARQLRCLEPHRGRQRGRIEGRRKHIACQFVRFLTKVEQWRVLGLLDVERALLSLHARREAVLLRERRGLRANAVQRPL